MKTNRTISAIILMGGSGERFGSKLPKQFHRICGKKIYLHTLDTFINLQVFKKVILVCHPNWIEKVSQDISSYPKDLIKIIQGAPTRQESSYLGILACKPSTEAVIIHDAVRPFVSEEIIKNHIQALETYEALNTCIPSTDTIVHSVDANEITSIPNRKEYFRGQTPQSFHYSLILDAHKQALSQNIHNASDDCQLITNLGKKVHIILGEERNQKITTELDLFLAEQILRLSSTLKDKRKDFSSLQGKTIAVTGGTGGIGKAIVDLLHLHGAKALPISTSSLSYMGDLSDPENVEKIFRQITADHGEIDALINSVGILKVGEFQDLDPKDLESMISTNIKAVLYSCKYAKIKLGGHIVNIASSSYIKGRKGLSVYSCSKAAIVNFTQALAEELPGVHINAIVPQRTDTKMRRDNFPGESTDDLLTPSQVAETVLELLCKEKITGLTIEVRKNGET
ncbi:MAG: 2-C-methyl-D-erythritol 4-phosphate cytidylyltransferase [Chlamydiae bacterium]|nr:2-C-methyl-D-erythritol 4-phosphate cytidylyltransferase [Chlamydiota bacterium]